MIQHEKRNDFLRVWLGYNSLPLEGRTWGKSIRHLFFVSYFFPECKYCTTHPFFHVYIKDGVFQLEIWPMNPYTKAIAKKKYHPCGKDKACPIQQSIVTSFDFFHLWGTILGFREIIWTFRSDSWCFVTIWRITRISSKKHSKNASLDGFLMKSGGSSLYPKNAYESARIETKSQNIVLENQKFVDARWKKSKKWRFCARGLGLKEK